MVLPLNKELRQVNSAAAVNIYCSTACVVLVRSIPDEALSICGCYVAGAKVLLNAHGGSADEVKHFGFDLGG